MLALAFFSWWYGQGWAAVIKSFGRRLRKTSHAFSVSLLLGTLFSPWRRIITPPGSSLAEHFRAMGDNIVSRAVGFVVRLLVLLAALVTLLAIGLFSLIELAMWPVLPVAVVALVIWGIVL